MLTHPDSQLFYRDTVHKEWKILVVEDNFTITNDILYKDEITWTDNLCSKDDITIGACESASLEFKFRTVFTAANPGATYIPPNVFASLLVKGLYEHQDDEYFRTSDTQCRQKVYYTRTGPYKGKTLQASIIINNDISNPVPIGKFTVDEESLEEDDRVTKIKAYDDLHELISKDFARWFNTLTNSKYRYEAANPGGTVIIQNRFNMFLSMGLYEKNQDGTYTLTSDISYSAGKTYYLKTETAGTWTCKEFRDSFFEYAGIEQENVELVNDWVPFTFKITNSSETNRKLDEEKERRKQELEYAKDGITTCTYDLIDPSTYDDYKYNTVNTADYPQDVNPHDEGWFEKNQGTYSETTDTSVNSSKTYYKKKEKKVEYLADSTHGFIPTYVSVTPTPAIIAMNPSQQHWFERNLEGMEFVYFLTNDSIYNIHKTYYTQNNYSASINPKTNKWYKVKDSGFVRASETTLAYGRTYYQKISVDVTDNPKLLEWYDRRLDQEGQLRYFPTEDETITPGKNYYEKNEKVREKPKYVKVLITPMNYKKNPSEEEWYNKNQDGTYTRTTDTIVRAEHSNNYYILANKENSSAFIVINTELYHNINPKEQGLYELQNDNYILTEDVVVQQGKVYYANIYDTRPDEPNDVIEDKIEGSEIVQAICEINGCFGHIGRNGKFKYIQLKPIDYDNNPLYPSVDLYPASDLYPAGVPEDESIGRGYYEDITKSSFIVQKLDRLVICKEDGDAGYIYPVDSTDEGHNTYKITGNFIWYSFTGDQATLDLVGNALLAEGIGKISAYTPCQIDMMGNPCIEVGDTLKIHTRTGDIYTYVLSRTLSGHQRMKDSIEAKGNEKKVDENSNLYNAVIELKGKSNILNRTMDETRNEIIDVSEGLTSLIRQTAESITLSVSKDVKEANDNSRMLYEAATEYTKEMIKDTVSKTVYDNNDVEIARRFSEFERTAEHIQAKVEMKADSEASSEGFMYELTSNAFRLSCKGGFQDVTNQLDAINRQTPINPSTYQLRIDGDDYYIYDLKSDTHMMGRTEDDTFKTNKSYYIEGNSSSDYRDVFICTSAGVRIAGVLTVDDLDVRNVATVSSVQTVSGEVVSVQQNVGSIQDTVDGLVANLDTLIANKIQAAQLNATNVQAGTMSANQIDTASLRTKVIDILGSDMSSGTITIGKVRAQYYEYYNGTGYSRIGTKQIQAANGTFNALCVL